MNPKSLSVQTGDLFFTAVKTNLVSGFFLTIGFMTSMPGVFIILLKKFGFLFVILFPLKSDLYPNIDSSDWLTEDIQWHIDKVFRETLMV